MRVLITSPVFPPDLGGPAVYVPSLARFLQEQGHQVTVVAFCKDEKPTGYPFEVVAIARGSLPIRYLRAFFAVLREARLAQVVYVNEHLALMHVLAARLAARPVAIRMMVDGAWEISHRRGWIGSDDINTFQTRRYGLRVRLTRALQRFWWGRCARIIAPSRFLRDIAVQRYGVDAGKVLLISNAYHGPASEEVPWTPIQAREKLGLPPGRRYLLTICRLMVWKRVDGILRVLASLPSDVDLLIAGEGPEEEAWKQLARELGLAERARFLGNVAYSEIPLWIRAADIFVLNSEYEGLSHTLLEVQALGTPVVCTDVCGNPEVVSDGENGLLVAPGDDRALGGALNRLLLDKTLRDRLSARGSELAARFDRTRSFTEVERTLEELSNGRSGR
jgi:glycosyltransferase involved in cell wall biosynthesis